MGLYIGVDLGTSSVKLVLADGDGNMLQKNTLYPIALCISDDK